MKSLKLPPGQLERATFPRFGLSQYADRFPSIVDKVRLHISGDLKTDFYIESELDSLPLVTQVSDFHCVATWSKTSLEWSGYRFTDVYQQLILPKSNEKEPISFVVIKAQDGYKTSLPLHDLLESDTMLAISLNGKPLNIAHGAPIRLVVPKHYGYKNLKHLDRLEFYNSPQKVKQGFLSFMDHPRARVAFEERAVGGPGWFFRYLYRPLIKSTEKQFERALKAKLLREL